MPINDPGVSKVHCKLEVSDTGMITLSSLSAGGTWLNGMKVVKRMVVKPTDELRLGSSFTVQVKDLLTQENYNDYTNYIYVTERFKSVADIEAFINTASKHSVDEMPAYVMPVVRSALAYYYIQEGRLYDAQMLLYEVGDLLYGMQDGTELLQGVYASILDLVGKLYVEVGKLQEAKICADAATGIFRRIAPDKPYSTVAQRESVQQLSEIVNN